MSFAGVFVEAVAAGCRSPTQYGLSCAPMRASCTCRQKRQAVRQHMRRDCLVKGQKHGMHSKHCSALCVKLPDERQDQQQMRSLLLPSCCRFGSLPRLLQIWRQDACCLLLIRETEQHSQY